MKLTVTYLYGYNLKVQVNKSRSGGRTDNLDKNLEAGEKACGA